MPTLYRGSAFPRSVRSVPAIAEEQSHAIPVPHLGPQLVGQAGALSQFAVGGEKRIMGKMEADGHRITHQVDNGRNADRDNCPSKWYPVHNPAVKCPQLSASTFHCCAHERCSVRCEYGSQIKPTSRPRERREVLREKCNPSGPTDRVRNEKEHHDSRVP